MRKNRFLKKVMCGFLIGMAAAFLNAVSIEGLCDQARRNNAELRFYEAEVAAMQGERTQTGLWKNPEISGEYGERRIKDSAGELQNEGTTRRISVTQTFEFPGKASLRKAIANQNMTLAQLGLKQFEQSLEGQVRSLAVQYQRASQNAEAAGEISERSHGLVKLLQERSLPGTQQLLELRIIEGTLIGLQESTKEFVQLREESRIALNALLGVPSSLALKIESISELPSIKIEEESALILLGLSHNLQLKMRTVELEKAIQSVTAERLEVAPDFSVGPFLSQDKAGDREENYGGTVSLTIPLWNWNQGNIAKAKAHRAQADAMLLEARRKVEGEIARCYRAYELNRKLIEQIPENRMNQLREAADLADRQYRTGSVGVQLFLEMQRGYLSSLQTRNAALLNLWRNWLDLNLLTGGGMRISQSPALSKGSQ